ncbi:MAG: hypothetical protein IT430_01765 [Phycisphaerales bacterium]|nr:hypothetical protein [Phycisphaerales bacterium]
MTKPLLIATILALGGCAASYTEPSLPADHPASVAAEEAPLPTRWTTLDLVAADPLGPMPGEPAMDHAGHGADEKAAPPQPEAGEHKHETPPPAATAGGAAPAVYSCPMHPEVTSDKPDQRCPKCGMNLEKHDGGKQP